MTANSEPFPGVGTTAADGEGARSRSRRWTWLYLLVLIEAVAIAGLAWKLFRERRDSSQELAFLHATLGREKEDAGDLNGALKEYGTAVKLYPENSRAWYFLALVLRRQRQEGGLAEFRKAAQLDPGHEPILRDYGQALVENAKLDEARSVLTRAIALKPEDEAAHVALGRAYLGNVSSPEDLAKGLAELRRALEIQPGEVQTRFRLARALFQANRLAEAKQEFQTTLSLLADGGRQSQEPLDGANHWSQMWLNLVKGCHHHLSEIAYRARSKPEAEAHRRTFDAMEAYLRDTYPLFKQRSQSPQDPRVRNQLAAIFARYGFPPDGPDGRAAASRWIGNALHPAPRVGAG